MDFRQVTNITIPEGSVVKIADPNGLILWQKQSTFDGLCFTALESGSYGMSHYGTNQTTTIPKLQYSRDGVNWTDWLFESINVNAGSKVYFRGDNPDGIGRSSTNYSKFTSTAKFAASGNIMSILGVDEMNAYGFYSLFSINPGITTAPELPATTLAPNCYSNMFSNCTSLTTAPELPATTLADICYSNMFTGCIKLTSAPELPATTLADICYYGMFYGCTALTETPVLPATTLASSCYYSMFNGCTSLTSTPKTLPATELAYDCYGSMFEDCTALTETPVLPATTLASSCYRSMFQGCTALTTAPELPATTLASSCYYGMFSDCTALTTAPELPAIAMKTNCYQYMFRGCTNLNSVKHSIINWNTSYATNWLRGVATSGVVRCRTNSNIPRNDASGIPSGWSRVNF